MITLRMLPLGVQLEELIKQVNYIENSIEALKIRLLEVHFDIALQANK